MTTSKPTNDAPMIPSDDNKRNRLMVAGDVVPRPLHLPLLSFVRWGVIGNETRFGVQRGFYIANHGGEAFDVTVESFWVTGRKAMTITIAKIAEGEQGFAPVWLDGDHTGSRWELDVALGIEAGSRIKRKKMSRGQTLPVPVSVIYRDKNQLWYRSHCQMTFSSGRIGFSPPVQESLVTTGRRQPKRRS